MIAIPLKPLFRALLVVAGTGFAGQSQALPPRMSVSAQLAYAAPFGDLSGDTYYVSHTYVAKVPLRLRAAWRPVPIADIGVSFSFGLVPVNAALTDDLAFLSGLELGAGIDIELHPFRGRLIDSWIGLGVGASTLTGRFDEGRMRERWTGIVLSRLEIGAMTPAFGGMWVGPYTALEVGRFTQYSMSGAGESGAYRIPNTSLHYWAEMGLRVSVAGSAP